MVCCPGAKTLAMMMPGGAASAFANLVKLDDWAVNADATIITFRMTDIAIALTIRR